MSSSVTSRASKNSKTSTVKVASNVTSAKRPHTELSPEHQQTMDELTINGSIQSEVITQINKYFDDKLSKIDEKLSNLPTKADFNLVSSQIFAMKGEIKTLREENCALNICIQKLEKEREAERSKVNQLEEQIKKRNLIFRNIDPEGSLIESVKAVCRSKLKLNKEIDVISTKWLNAKDGKISVAAELGSEQTVEEVLKCSRNLAGTEISVSRDLSSFKLIQKKIMLELKKVLLSLNPNITVYVRDHKLKVANKWFVWRKNKQLYAGRSEGISELKRIYGDAINEAAVNYNELEIKTKSKNL